MSLGKIFDLYFADGKYNEDEKELNKLYNVSNNVQVVLALTYKRG